MTIDDLVRGTIRGLNEITYSKDTSGKISLALGEMPFPPSPKVIAAIHKHAHLVNRYPSESKRVINALAHYVGVDSTQIVLGNGSDELIELITETFVNPGEHVLIPIPTFPEYELAARKAGGVPMYILRADTFEINPEEVLEHIKPGAKLIFIANPNNPTGNTLQRADIITITAQSGCIVVIDECYYEMYGKTVVDLIDTYQNLIVLRSFSKTFSLAGLRAGYAIANETISGYISRAKPPFNVNRIAQAAILAALDDITYTEEMISRMKAEKARLIDALTELNLNVFPSETNFLLVNCGTTGKTSTELVDALYTNGIVVKNGNIYNGLEKDTYIWFGVGTKEEDDALITSLDHILVPD